MNKYRDGLQKRPANYAALTPISFLERSALVYPDKPAIIDGDRAVTYREMFARCRRMADALRKAGVGELDTVSVFAPNGVAALEMHFAAPMAGAVLNAVNFRLDAATVAFILEHAESKVFMFDAELAPVARAALERIDRPLTVVEIGAPQAGHPASGDFPDYESFLAAGETEAPIAWPADEWTAIALNYTSGTTGNPKGVVCHHRGAYLNALGQGLASRLGPDSVYLWTLPMFHCNGWTYTWGVVAAGGTNVVQRAIVPAEIFAKIDRHGVTNLCGAPTVLNMLAFAPGSETRRLKQNVRVMVGGAAPTSTVIGAMERMGFTVVHAYGLTETYGPATVCEMQPEWPSLELQEKAKLIARQGVRYITSAGLSVIDPETGAMLPADGALSRKRSLRSGDKSMATLFFDSSGLVKRYIDETGTNWVRMLNDSAAAHNRAIAQITGAEMIAAVTRRLRRGDIAPNDSAAAILGIEADFASDYLLLETSLARIREAMALARIHGLRGYDAVQLASALFLRTQCRSVGQSDPVVITADRELAAAAVAEGLIVDNPDMHG